MTSDSKLCCTSKMCEKRIKKIKKGSHLTRQREARRLQRLQRLTSPPLIDDNSIMVPCPTTVHKITQNRVIIDLAWKTLALMQKNRLIQEKIIALKKETSEFLESVMSNPINRERYLEHMRLYGSVQSIVHIPANTEPVQVDSKV